MTQVQWDKHMTHYKDHIKWPASKEDIVKACSGEDVEPEVLQDIKNNLPEGKIFQNPDEVKNFVVM